MPTRRRPSPKRVPVVPARSAEEAKPRPRRGSLLVVFLWAAGAVAGLALFAGLLFLQLTGGISHGTRWTFLGTAILMGVLALAAGVKAIEAFVNWRGRG